MMDLSFLVSDLDAVSQNEDYEVRDWCRILDCTPVELSEAVAAVGSSAQAVRRFLDNKRGVCFIPSSLYAMSGPRVYPGSARAHRH